MNNSILSEALFTKTQRGVLGLLFGNSERSYYANEIVRHAGAGIGTVQRELGRLSAAGLLTVTRIGNQKHYQANHNSPIFDELVAIASKIIKPEYPMPGRHEARHAAHEQRAGYVKEQKAPALNVSKRRLAAFCRRNHIKRLGLFGSAARGELTDTSDVDLLVEFKKGVPVGLFEMVRMRDELAELFGHKVDLATSSILENPYRRRSILKDLRQLYAA